MQYIDPNLKKTSSNLFEFHLTEINFENPSGLSKN